MAIKKPQQYRSFSTLCDIYILYKQEARGLHRSPEREQ